ncbi:MAG TPA: GH92 family glycosyl hydrolase [Verrucomicrobiae bacterium]|nr:GH92 family glycosyl hydrolase [Verrucomicrobiae bacterium]
MYSSDPFLFTRHRKMASSVATLQIVLATAASILSFSLSAIARDPVDEVEPRWGAGMNQLLPNQTDVAGHDPAQPGLHSVGDMFPEIAVPWPMAIWSPQTHTGAWFDNNLDPDFQGFRCTHEAHPWAGDYGQFTIMPEVGTAEIDPVRRASPFSHGQEFARPYDYRIYLPRYETWAELAPTKRCAILQFDFPKTNEAHIVISAQDASITTTEMNHELVVAGKVWRNVGDVPTNFACQFVVEFKPQPVAVHLYADKDNLISAVLTFDTTHSPVVRMRVGTSFISATQAELNLRREISDWNVKAVARQARKDWNRQLERIELGVERADQSKIFYTSLYWVLLYPHSFYEIDEQGREVHYNPTNGRVYSGQLYTGTGFWDVFRCAFPLLTMVYPEQDGHIVNGLLNFYKEGGWLPTWPNPGYWNCMVGTDADPVIAEACLQGIQGFDLQIAYAAIRKDGTVEPDGHGHGIPHLKDYLRLGYLPANVMSEATSTTLEEAYDDYCIAQVAQALGNNADYEKFSKLALNYMNVFNPAVKFPWGRTADGRWQPGFDPLWWGSPFTEDDAWTYVWEVMQDPYGLIQLLGGRPAAIARLDEYFTTNSDFHIGAYANWGHPIPEQNESVILGMGQYGPNNEPSSHDAFFYDFLDEPWKAQYWVRQTLAWVYNSNGMVGDGDEGQMGAWYIFNMAGFYPFSPVAPDYLIGSPAAGRVTFHLPHGKIFTVRSVNNGPENYYIQSATLNGKAFNQTWISQQTILQGGTLKFLMGPKPNTNWGTDTAALPPSGDLTQPRKSAD